MNNNWNKGKSSRARGGRWKLFRSFSTWKTWKARPGSMMLHHRIRLSTGKAVWCSCLSLFGGRMSNSTRQTFFFSSSTFSLHPRFGSKISAQKWKRSRRSSWKRAQSRRTSRKRSRRMKAKCRWRLRTRIRVSNNCERSSRQTSFDPFFCCPNFHWQESQINQKHSWS